MDPLHEAIRTVLHRAGDTWLCARQVAERVTSDTGSQFGGCGPETEDVEEALRSMGDVEEDWDDEGMDPGDVDCEIYHLREST